MSVKEDRTPGSMLEVYMHALASRTNDAFLDQVNLGVGNYTEAEYWQQVEAFRKGLFADSSMTRKVMERARLQTKRAIVDAIFDEHEEGEEPRLLDRVNDYPVPGEGDCDCPGKREYFDEHAEDIWMNLGDPDEGYTMTEHQAWLVHKVTGIPSDWVPPHWRMLKMRHEASRSKDARLIDNLFGRPPEPTTMEPIEEFE